MLKDTYQTVPLPDGTVLPGLFPTTDWFKKICRHVSFKGHTVLDLGCNIFSYGIQAIQAGATSAVGVDTNELVIGQAKELVGAFGFSNVSLLVGDIEQISLPKADIVIFGNVLHWLRDPKQFLRGAIPLARDKFVLISRHPTDSEGEFGWRPTVEELNDFLNLTPVGVEILVKDSAQHIVAVVYDKTL